MADVSNIDQAFAGGTGGDARGIQPQSSHMATTGSRAGAGLRGGKFRDKQPISLRPSNISYTHL